MPHRSLSPRGFVILMAVICTISFITGVIFTLKGAWPVLGFLSLNVVAVYWAFRQNYKDAKIFETIKLTADHLVLERVYPSGRHQSFEYNPFWVQVGIEEHSSGATKMRLTSHGKSINFGKFLSDDERREFVHVLRQEINRAKYSIQPER